MKKNIKQLQLIKDVHRDPYFSRALKIIFVALLMFFAIDAAIGIFLTKGLEKYYGLGTSAEIALVGHSHLMLGVDKSLLEQELGVQVAKYTREGVNVGDRQIMIRQLLQKNPALKLVIYGVDAWSFTGEGLSANSYALFYPFMGDKDANDYIKQQTSFSDYWIHKLLKTSRFNEGLISSSFRGYLKNWTNLKFGEVDTERLRKQIEAGDYRKINNSQTNIDILKTSINELSAKNIKVILLYIPTIDLYNLAEANKFKETLRIFQQMDHDSENVTFLNYLDPWSHDYSLFFDPIHMNPKGQKLVTGKLIEDLNQRF